MLTVRALLSCPLISRIEPIESQNEIFAILLAMNSLLLIMTITVLLSGPLIGRIEPIGSKKSKKRNLVEFNLFCDGEKRPFIG